MDVHKLASLLLRDHTIIAKRLHDMARDYRAMADIWRLVLDDAVPIVLGCNEQGKTVSSELLPPQESSADPFGPNLEFDYD